MSNKKKRKSKQINNTQEQIVENAQKSDENIVESANSNIAQKQEIDFGENKQDLDVSNENDVNNEQNKNNNFSENIQADLSDEIKETNQMENVYVPEVKDIIYTKPNLIHKLKDKFSKIGPTPESQETLELLEQDKQNKNPLSYKVKVFFSKYQKRILSFIVIFVLISGLFAINMQKQITSNLKTKDLVENSTVITWVNLFMNESYVNADNYLANTNYRIYNYTFLETVDETEYYETAISYLSKCIESVKVDNIVQGQYNNQSVYTLKVTINPYKKLETLENSLSNSDFSDKLTELRDECVTNSISEYEYNTKLQDLALEIYKESCFQPETQTIELTLMLAQQENEKGDMVVYGVEDFISELMDKSNVYYNTEIYQNEIAIYLQDNTIKSENIDETENTENLDNTENLNNKEN